MGQNTAIRTDVAKWDFLEPAMVPDYARTDHSVLLKPGSNTRIYRAGQVVFMKSDGTNEVALPGTGGYAGPARIIKYDHIINSDGYWQYGDTWVDGGPQHEGSVSMYYRGYFRTEDLLAAGGSAANKVYTETVDGDVDGGTRVFTFRGHTTDPIDHDANSTAIQTALEAIIGAGNVVVAGSNPFTITFQGVWAGSNVPNLILDASLLTDGGTPVEDGSAIVVTTPGAGNLSGVGKLLRGTVTTGIMELGAAQPV